MLAGERKTATPANDMTNTKSNTSEVRADQAAGKPCENIKLGLDVDAETIVVVRIVENSTPQPAQRFVWADFLTWAKKQLPLAKHVHSCYEAGPFGYGLHRQLVAMGIKNVVVQPVCLDERKTGVNNDKTDARELAMRLDRFVAGNKRAVATVRVPEPEEEQKRIESRQREQLKREVQRITAQGRALLLTQGVRQLGDWWQEDLWKFLKPGLAAWLVKRLEVFRRVLEAVTKELDSLTKALEEAAPDLRPKGLGALTSTVVEREIGNWSRFSNRRQVGSYTGLCGGVSSSGKNTHLLSITKHGNPRLRTALVELAWRLVVWQPQCRLVKKWEGVLKNKKASRAARKKAIVAVARQMAVDLWRWRTGRVKPEELGWKMVGL